MRGSAPVSGWSFRRYGGATTSFLIQASGATDSVVIDAGSGLSRLAPRVTGECLMLFTHFHLDHLIGLTNFPRLYSNPELFAFAAPELEGCTLEAAVKRLIAPPFWPVTPFGKSARFQVPPTSFGGFGIRWTPVAHPNGCVAYRLDHAASGQSVVFATDLEWPAMSPARKDAFLALCRGADVLVMDGALGEEADADRYKGWGHSTWEACVDVARLAGVPKLFITHHAPEATDAVLARRQRELAARMPSAEFAREGQSFVL